MIKDFAITETNVIMNFSISFCDTEEEILSSEGFKKVLNRFVKDIAKNKVTLYKHFYNIGKRNLEELMIDIFKNLLIFKVDEVKKINKLYHDILQNKEMFLDFIEELYTFWRSFERYAILQSKVRAKGIQDVNFIEGTNTFTNLVLRVYRNITETVLNSKQTVYRQLTAGVNAGIVLGDPHYTLPTEYEVLNSIATINKIILRPPFIVYSKKNTRSGTYKEAYTNPLEGIRITASHWFCYPAMVGEFLTYVYFHRDFMAQGMGLCNLFKLASVEECENRKPDLVYVYGAPIDEFSENSYFYHDKQNDIYLGVAYHTEQVDYFGYMKKMLLTLHNTKMIDQGNLPIHGAMVNVTMKNGKQANIVIMGDSGAGKSESLNALRSISEKYLKEMNVIFDDMGTLKIVNNKVMGYGTEIGAFVRLDDLDSGYAYREMDRAIFMNPNKINARLIIPISNYSLIMKGYPIDLFLYANNYDEGDKDIIIFDNMEDALNVFRLGRRKAKGTTTEVGLVESYFANPFGPVQRKEQTEILLNKYFSKMYSDKIPVGEMYTKLAIPGFEFEGPKIAAIKLFEWIKKEGK